MDHREVQAALDKLWEGHIQELHFDPLGNRISFSIWMIDEDERHDYSLVFEDVASFHYLHNDGERRLNLWPLEPGDYLELSNAWYEPDGIGQIVAQSGSGLWSEHWWSSANFHILLWTGILLVEAGRVIVDGQAFEVGYPPT